MESGQVANNQSGQAVTEMILLVAMVVFGFILVRQGLDRMGFSQKLMRPLQKEFAAAYQFGHPKATGFEDGETPKYHPRYVEGESNLRLFLNPGRK